MQNLLDGFGGDRRNGAAKATARPANAFGVECYHVDARLSRDQKDIGGFRAGKFFALLGFCLQAIGCRFRYGVTIFI